MVGHRICIIFTRYVNINRALLVTVLTLAPSQKTSWVFSHSFHITQRRSRLAVTCANRATVSMEFPWLRSIQMLRGSSGQAATLPTDKTSSDVCAPWLAYREPGVCQPHPALSYHYRRRRTGGRPEV